MKTPPRMTKLPGDLVEMLSTIAWFQDKSIADVADGLVRDAIAGQFQQLPKAVRDKALAKIEAFTATATAAASTK